MPGIFNTTAPSLGGITRAASKVTTAPKGASAINAAARNKAAANASAEASRAQTAAQTQQTANVTPNVVPMVGRQPVTQGAYEQQAQTTLQGNIASQQQQTGQQHQLQTLGQTQQFQGAENDADRQQRLVEQQNEIAAREKEMQAQAAAQRGEMELAASLSAQADARRMGQISTLSRTMMGDEGEGSAAPQVDQSQARAAAFARAKERAGQTALSGIKSLQDVMAGSGKMGSSMEASGMASILGEGVGDINEFTRDEMIMDVNRAADIEDRNFSAALTKRGQNMNMNQSLLGLMKGGGVY